MRVIAEAVEPSPLPVLLDMGAPWRGPGRVVGPVLAEPSGEWAGRVRVGKPNVDESPATATRFGVNSVPTLLVFTGGREVDRLVGLVGARPKAEIARRLGRGAGGKA